jgi:addiction module HigA family antidote
MQKIQDLRSLPKRLERLEPRLRNHGVTMHIERISQVHPGRVLLEEFLAPRGISVWHLAKDIGVSARRIYEIVQAQRPITSDIAHRLAHYFGMSERYWLDLQARYDGKGETKLSQEISRRQSLRYAG